MMRPHLFDSHALLAFFQKEDGAETTRRILTRALNQNVDRLICIINLGEIIYMTKRRFGNAKKLEVLGHIHELGFKVLSVSDTLVYKAAEIKAEYAISYADCFAVACAIEHSAVIVTGDPEFNKVAHLAPIKWIGRSSAA